MGQNGDVPKSQTYLSRLVTQVTTLDDLEIYQIMRAAGQIESLLGLGAHAKAEKSPQPGKQPPGIEQATFTLS